MSIASRDEIAKEGFVYLAGAYRGRYDTTSYTEIDKNINVARFWAKELAERDIPLFCPHLNSAHFEVIAPTVAQEYWLRMDLVLLAHAKAIFLLPGYQISSGAMNELLCAKKWGIPDFYAQSVANGSGIEDLVTLFRKNRRN